MGALDSLIPTPVALRKGQAHLKEDFAHLKAGRLDVGSFRSGYKKWINPVEVRTTSVVPNDYKAKSGELVTDPSAFSDGGATFDGKVWRDKNYGMQRRVWREIRRSHNLRLNTGRDQIQRIQTFGDVGASLNGAFATYTGSTATTLTGCTGQPTTTSAAGNAGLVGHYVYCTHATVANSAVGVIISNTATVITVDQWYALPLTGAAGTTPASSAGTAWIVPGGTMPFWVALSTSSAGAVATDVTRTAEGLWGDGTTSGTATEQTGSGLARAYCGQGGGTAPTIPAVAQEQFNHTWTYSGSTLVTIPKVVLYNSLAFAGTIPMLETLLNAQATVNTSGDTIQLAGWLISF